MSNIALDPVSKAFVMYDILNEPDSQGLGWDFMTKAYLDVIQQGQDINPGIYGACGMGTICNCSGDVAEGHCVWHISVSTIGGTLIVAGAPSFGMRA